MICMLLPEREKGSAILGSHGKKNPLIVELGRNTALAEFPGFLQTPPIDPTAVGEDQKGLLSAAVQSCST